VAFVVVFCLLSFLALVMLAITNLFPPGEPQIDPRAASRNASRKRALSASKSDPVVIAAVAAAVNALIPGAHVVNMEEDR
jgi:Na+-transporting methylmalonyl-CoA/oxaloacetate decarboxylase gamma subunit